MFGWVGGGWEFSADGGCGYTQGAFLIPGDIIRCWVWDWALMDYLTRE